MMLTNFYVIGKSYLCRGKFLKQYSKEYILFDLIYIRKK